MKKLFALSIIFFVAVYFVSAQSDETIQPKSFKLSVAEIPEVVLPAFVMSAAEQADITDAKNGELPKFSRSINTNITLDNAGKWTVLPTGDRIWQVKITSANALALIPLFNKLFLPEGALLHVYTPKHEETLGAFTHNNTLEPRSFCTGVLHGETCVIEYFEPVAQKGKGIVSINEVGHAYRWVTPLKDANAANAAGACEVNVTCSEATNWADQVRGVARILVVGSQGQGYCSGSLINNVRQDCTPYLFSAEHCVDGATALQFGQWVFYFNYQASTCTGTTGSQNKTVNGCTEVAESNDNGGATGSDFVLLLLNSAPTSTYNVYYNGWDNTGTASPSGVCIHHPNGDIKKISTYTQAITTTSWGGSVQNTHWDVHWAATTNGNGVTEPGSSGSPLFANTGLIIGTLTGGNSFCNTPNNPDQFGRVYYDWLSNGSANNRRLKPWLDPDNTGATSLAGTNTPCGSTIQNDAGILNISDPVGNICASSFTPSFVLRNYGGNVLHSVTINYQIDGNVYQYNWTGNLAAGSSTTITLGAVTLANGNHTFTAETTLPNGVTDNNLANDAKATNFVIIPASSILNLLLKTDSYGSETSWDVQDASNNVIVTGGPYGDVTGGETMNIPVCLAAGCYTFTIYDSNGDGMNSGGNPDFQLTGNGGSPIYASLSTVNFGSQESHQFCIAGTGIAETNSFQLRIIPNPSTGMFNLLFNNEEEKIVRVFDALGRMITERKTADKNFAINLSNQSKGVYVLQVETKAGNAIRKVVVE